MEFMVTDKLLRGLNVMGGKDFTLGPKQVVVCIFRHKISCLTWKGIVELCYQQMGEGEWRQMNDWRR